MTTSGARSLDETQPEPRRRHCEPWGAIRDDQTHAELSSSYFDSFTRCPPLPGRRRGDPGGAAGAASDPSTLSRLGTSIADPQSGLCYLLRAFIGPKAGPVGFLFPLRRAASRDLGLLFWSPRSDSNRRPSDYESKRNRPAGAIHACPRCSRQRGLLLSAFLTCRVTAGG
jgi:hypothetical protein